MRQVRQPYRLLLLIVAAVLAVAGMILLPTPFPGGAPLLTLALVIAVTASRTAAGLVRAARRRLVPLDRLIGAVETNGGTRLRRVLRKTRPLRIGVSRPASRKRAVGAWPGDYASTISVSSMSMPKPPRPT